MAAKNYKEIPVAALEPGMTVVKLDISWLDSPFLSHTRRIKGAEDIYALKNAGVKMVVIDLDHSQPLPGQQAIAEQRADALSQSATDKPSVAPHQAANDPLDISAPRPAEPTPAAAGRVPLAQELTQAAVLRKQIKAAVLSLQQSFERQCPVSTTELGGLVDDTLASLGRNNQALLTLVHLSRKSQKLADHAFGCFCLTLGLAIACGLDACERRQLGLAALLHEAGWAQIPLNLMGKRAAYNEEELHLVARHVELADRLLAGSDVSPLCLRLIREHHERPDGSGFPRGLSKHQLHPLSQLLAVADSYEERVHELGDQPGMTPTAALRALYKEAQLGRLDETFVGRLISMLGIYPVMSVVELNSGERGLVREVHEATPLQPVLEIHYDSNGQPLTGPRILDLSRQDPGPGRVIRQVLDRSDSRLDPLGRFRPELSQIA